MLQTSAARAVSTLVAGAAGGAVFAALGLPAGWLAGSALATAAASLVGLRLDVPRWIRFPTLVVMGMAMGSAMTPAVLDRIVHWPVSLALMLVSVFASFAAGAIYLQRVHGWDAATARLCATPGALSTVLAIASESRAQVPVVAFSHALRQFFLMCLIPLVFALQPGPSHARVAAGPADFLIMLVAALAVGMLCKRLRFPAALLFGAMIGSSAVHLADLATGAPPPILQNAALVVLGAITGTAFSQVRPVVLRAALMPAIGCLLVSSVIAVGFALLASLLTGIPAPQLLISYAPGGVEGMNALSVALNLDPAFVSIHHLVRLLALMLLSPFWTRSIMARDLRADVVPTHRP